MVEDKNEYYVVKKRALPEVLLNVVKAKELLETQEVATIQEAASKVGISRSSFYKYKEDIFPFRVDTRGRTITCMIQLKDRPGLLADIMTKVAMFKGNILTVHQSIPINGVATLTLSIELNEASSNVETLIYEIESMKHIYKVKILARE